MLTVGILITLAIVSKCQIPPNWTQDLYVQADDIIIVDNQNKIPGNYFMNVTYKSSKANPMVGISIRKLGISQPNNISVQTAITSPNNSGFICNTTIGNSSTVWLFVMRYFVVDWSVTELQYIQMIFLDTLNTLNTTNCQSPITNCTLNSTFLPPYFISTHNFAIAVFTVAFDGYMAPDFYVNVTCISPQIGNNISITIVAATGIETLDRMAFYVFIADLDGLAINSLVFVQTYKAYSWYGKQQNFYNPSPNKFYQSNYISGLESFSMISNTQYNFTISNLTFTTSLNSQYNDVSYFNLWDRTCTTLYPLYNKVDKLCYQLCPNKTYQPTNLLVCQPCNYSCASCANNSSCIACPSNRTLDPTTFLCVCQDYNYQVKQVCLPCHYSCKTCDSGQLANCLTCDNVTAHRLPNNMSSSTSEGYCNCSAGYQDARVTICIPICGDNYTTPQQMCDDGNVVSGDGCSSTCQIQNGYECYNFTFFNLDNNSVPSYNPSYCFYTQLKSITVVRIQKDPISNNALFYLQVTPFVPQMSMLSCDNLYTNISGICNSITVQNQQLICNISYFQSLEGQNIQIGLTNYNPNVSSGTGPLDNSNFQVYAGSTWYWPFTQFNPLSTTVVIHAQNGLRLDYYQGKDYHFQSQLANIAGPVGIGFMFVGILFCYGDWKELGLQLFFAIQYAFMSFSILQYISPQTTGFLHIKSIMGWNQLFDQQKPPYLKISVTEQMGYSQSFEHNFNLMAILPGFALIMYIAYRVGLMIHEKRSFEQKQQLQFEQKLYGKILSVFKFDFFVYWMLFNMQQVLMALVIQFQILVNPVVIVFVILCLVGILVSICALIMRPNSMEAYRKNLFHQSYGDKTFLMVLTSTLVMDGLLLCGVLINKFVFYVGVLFPGVIFMYTVSRRPFKLMWNNVRLAIIQLCIIGTIALQIVTLNTNLVHNYLFSIGVFILIAIAIFVTILVLLYKLVKLIKKKYKDEPDDESSLYVSTKQGEQINEKVREAGYALVHGNTSRVPTSYEMSPLPNSNSKKNKLDSYRLGTSPRDFRDQRGDRGDRGGGSNEKSGERHQKQSKSKPNNDDDMSSIQFKSKVSNSRQDSGYPSQRRRQRGLAQSDGRELKRQIFPQNDRSVPRDHEQHLNEDEQKSIIRQKKQNPYQHILDHMTRNIRN